MNVARRVAKNSVVQAAAFGAQGLTEFGVALLLARLAGPEQLGEFTTLIILAGLFAFIAAFGLPGLLTREISRIREDQRQISRLVDAALGLVVVLSTVSFILMVAIGIVSGYGPPLLRALALTAVALAFESMAMVSMAAFRGVEALEWSSSVVAIMETTFLLLGFIAILLRAPIDAVMAAYLASRAIALFVAVRSYGARFGRIRPTADPPTWRFLLTKGLPFSVNSVFSFAYSRADVVILSYLVGNVTVGFYVVAYSLTMRTNVVARALTLALYPLLAFQFSKDGRSMRAYTARGIRFLNVAGFFIAAALWVFGSDVVSLVYGAKFAQATSIAVKMLALAIPLRFLETSLGVTLDASNRARQRAMAVAIAAVTNALLNLVLIPHFQMLGAVYATMVTEAVIVGVFIWILRANIREIVTWQAFTAPALGVLLALTGLTLLSSVHLAVLIPLSVLLYVATIAVVDQSSIRSLAQIAMRRQA